MSKLERVLLIEDEPDIREIVKTSLELVGGLSVETSPDGLAGLQKAKEMLPDLILLDVMMPIMDGPMTLAELRKDPQLESIPVIFMTAKVQSQEVQSYMNLGVAGVLPKPFDPMSLTEQIKTIWSRYVSR